MSVTFKIGIINDLPVTSQVYDQNSISDARQESWSPLPLDDADKQCLTCKLPPDACDVRSIPCAFWCVHLKQPYNHELALNHYNLQRGRSEIYQSKDAHREPQKYIARKAKREAAKHRAAKIVSAQAAIDALSHIPYRDGK